MEVRSDDVSDGPHGNRSRTVADTKNWTGIVAGVSRFDSAGRTRVILTTPISKTERANLGLWVSTDEADT